MEPKDWRFGRWTVPFQTGLGGGNSSIFKIFIPDVGEDSHFDDHIFQMGWTHQLEVIFRFNTKNRKGPTKIWRMFFIFQVAVSMIFWSYHPANGTMESNVNILFQRAGQNQHVPSPEIVHFSYEKKGPWLFRVLVLVGIKNQYNQLLANWWFGLVVWIPWIPLWKGYLLGCTPIRTPNHQAPNYQFTIGWYKDPVINQPVVSKGPIFIFVAHFSGFLDHPSPKSPSPR